MTEPAVASSDATNIQSSIQRYGNCVLCWFLTSAESSSPLLPLCLTHGRFRKRSSVSGAVGMPNLAQGRVELCPEQAPVEDLRRKGPSLPSTHLTRRASKSCTAAFSTDLGGVPSCAGDEATTS